MKPSRRIILASTSPRRKELLEKAGVVFEVVGSNYEEDMTLALSPSELAIYLSTGKAEAVAQNYADAIVIGADTFVVYGGELLGKPHTPKRAKEMLQMLRGTVHVVVTGFTIIDTRSGTSICEAVETTLYLKDLSDQEINDYVATGEPLDKAGAYGIQGTGARLVDHIEGDRDNVIGLPVTAILKALEHI